MQYGFCAVIAPVKSNGDHVIPGFADIFKSNALKNGLLTIELTLVDVEELKNAIEKNPTTAMTIDLQAGEIRFANLIKQFHIDSATREKLLKGLDDIATTFLDENAIRDFEAQHDVQLYLI
jgi:3-isopropylmalate/(R)-2-methylmalate dehydratase small subunit